MFEQTLLNVENYQRYSSLSCGVLTPVVSQSRSVTSYPGVRSGTQNPKWRDQVKTGRNATTAYDRSGYIVDSIEPLTWRFTAKCSQSSVNKASAIFSGEILQHPGPTDFYGGPTANLTSASNQATMAFIHDAKAQYNSLSGGVFLGELRQTLTMIRNPAMALRATAESWLNLIRGRQNTFRTRREAENWLAKSWLEYSMGWAPLIADTKAGAEALSRLIHGDIRYASVKGFGKVENASKPTVIHQSIPNFALGTCTRHIVQLDTVIIWGGVSAKATGPTLDNAMNLFGFTAEEFVPTVWNLLPWSFLADYFVNIGDVLEATFFDSAGVTWTAKTTLSETSVVQSSLSPSTTPGWSGSGSGGSFKVRKKSMSRRTLQTFIPEFEVSVPGAPQQWINMAALAAMHKKSLPFNH